MMRHSRYGKVTSRESAELAPTLVRELGNPVYEDERIKVWDLRASNRAP